MSFRIAPQQSTPQASRIRKLIKDLGKKLENSYPGRSDYIPEEDLGKTITQNVIGEWLRHSSPDATNPTKLKSEIYCKGLKTFCILVSMEKEQCMKTFMDKLPWGPDRKLPWTSQENLKSFLDAPHLDWDRNTYVEFFEQQRRYQPHEISEGEMRELDKDLTVIPYLEECKDMKRGDIVKVKLDRRYFKPSSTRELGTGGFIEMMRKEIDVTGANEQRFLHYMDFLHDRPDEPHPNIIRLYASYQMSNKIHLLMPVCDTDLGNFLTDRTPSVHFPKGKSDPYLLAMLGLSRAIKWIHDLPANKWYNKTVIHRDLKPSNILVDQGKFILSDYGISSVSKPTEGRKQMDLGIVNWYTAPESFAISEHWEGEVSPASDMFSLGCIFSEIVAHIRAQGPGVKNFRERRRKFPYIDSSFCIEQLTGTKGRWIVKDEVWAELKAQQENLPLGKVGKLIALIRALLVEDPDIRKPAEVLVTELERIIEKPDLQPTISGNNRHSRPDAQSETSDVPQRVKVQFHPVRGGQAIHGAAIESEASSSHRPSSGDDDGGTLSMRASMRLREPPPAIIASLQAKHAKDLKGVLATELDVIQEGCTKAIWEKAQLIPPWTQADHSCCLLIHTTEEGRHEEELSMVSAQVIKSAVICSARRDMVVIYHFCHQNKSTGPAAVVNMMKSLIHQLHARKGTPSASWNGDLESLKLESLKNAFEESVRFVSKDTTLVCVIDGLGRYYDRDRAGQTKLVLQSIVERAAQSECRFKLLITVSGSPLANRIRLESKLKAEDVKGYDDGGLVNHRHGHSDRHFRKPALVWA